MGKVQVWMLVLFLAILGVVGALWQVYREPGHADEILVSGNIEITQVQVGFKLSGRMEQRFVKEGQSIQKDQKIAVLDKRDLQQEVKARQAEVEMYHAALLELTNGSLPEEIAAAEAKLEQARADLAYLRANQKRQQELFERQVISPKEFESTTSVYEIAKARHREAEENLRLLQRGTRVEQVKQAEARLQHAKEVLAQAETRLSDAELISPLAGHVLTTNVEAGEIVAEGTPVITVGNLDDIWLRAYIDETDLGKVKLGQLADVTTDSYPEKVYRGTISFISSEAEFTPKNVQTHKERVKLVYMIKITLENPLQELKPGMPADAVIHLANKKPT